MNALFYLIPVSLVLGIIALVAFYWTLKTAQYDDPEGDRFRVLGEDDKPLLRHTDTSR
ncbi:cytochrome oxidase maturation protein, cbb3-type [Tritonibacter multivorans]|uniref:Cytochrome oxidase maturation protein, cbb3-type n=1 Tax=Tritonibacter multivorans TaxID=928856 RepID=A0A0N7LZS4_9RHOB|nr:cbb3-type cytochrome oxidase assembly protein CcoS [Tritonibacter multivorans]MDA7422098.1 cbb3-type cytochrome oxidase assembly protein CcoS [Tritonibacter multivorans]CUH78473.1 cytochrome oxidase maturation protein, cbb3-type [Tritonibacter multivorans]SFD17387.1 cytochrome oxidase maturation protein, cbb3-type [Tritonibacter multivorans]